MQCVSVNLIKIMLRRQISVSELPRIAPCVGLHGINALACVGFSEYSGFIPQYVTQIKYLKHCMNVWFNVAHNQKCQVRFFVPVEL